MHIATRNPDSIKLSVNTIKHLDWNSAYKVFLLAYQQIFPKVAQGFEIPAMLETLIPPKGSVANFAVQRGAHPISAGQEPG